MNQTIRLFINNTETRHNKHLEIVKQLDSLQRNVLGLKDVIARIYIGNLNILTFVSSSDNEFQIIFKTSEYPVLLIFYLPKNVHDEFIPKNNLPNYPILVLDYILKAARKEYNEIGKKYNKTSSSNIGRSRKLWW